MLTVATRMLSEGVPCSGPQVRCLTMTLSIAYVMTDSSMFIFAGRFRQPMV